MDKKAPVGELAYPLRSERRSCGFESHPGYQADVVFNGSTGAFQAHGTSSNLVVRSRFFDNLLPGRLTGRTRGSEPRDRGSNPCRAASGRAPSGNPGLQIRECGCDSRRGLQRVATPATHERSSGVGGPHAGLKHRRSWFDSSGLHQAEEELGWSFSAGLINLIREFDSHPRDQMEHCSEAQW